MAAVLGSPPVLVGEGFGFDQQAVVTSLALDCKTGRTKDMVRAC